MSDFLGSIDWQQVLIVITWCIIGFFAGLLFKIGVKGRVKKDSFKKCYYTKKEHIFGPWSDPFVIVPEDLREVNEQNTPVKHQRATIQSRACKCGYIETRIVHAGINEKRLSEAAVEDMCKVFSPYEGLNRAMAELLLKENGIEEHAEEKPDVKEVPISENGYGAGALKGVSLSNPALTEETIDEWNKLVVQVLRDRDTAKPLAVAFMKKQLAPVILSTSELDKMAESVIKSILKEAEQDRDICLAQVCEAVERGTKTVWGATTLCNPKSSKEGSSRTGDNNSDKDIYEKGV